MHERKIHVCTSSLPNTWKNMLVLPLKIWVKYQFIPCKHEDIYDMYSDKMICISIYVYTLKIYEVNRCTQLTDVLRFVHVFFLRRMYVFSMWFGAGPTRNQASQGDGLVDVPKNALT